VLNPVVSRSKKARGLSSSKGRIMRRRLPKKEVERARLAYHG
jgi:hypothetical protein